MNCNGPSVLLKSQHVNKGYHYFCTDIHWLVGWGLCFLLGGRTGASPHPHSHTGLASSGQVQGERTVNRASTRFRVCVVETAGSTCMYSILSIVNLCAFFHLYCDMILFGGSFRLLWARRCLCCARSFHGYPA